LFESPTVAELLRIIIANEPKPGQTEKIARILKQVEGMSVNDVKKILEEKKGVQNG
jgi:hypothetical protein